MCNARYTYSTVQYSRPLHTRLAGCGLHIVSPRRGVDAIQIANLYGMLWPFWKATSTFVDYYSRNYSTLYCAIHV